MQILLLILDGLADRPQAMLGGRTPLEAARTPHLDRLATRGATGLLVPLAPGIPLESDLSHWILFGYPVDRFPGRTAFEAAGRGLEIGPDEVALLTSFAAASVLPDGRIRRDSLFWEAGDADDAADCRALVDAIGTYVDGSLRFTLRDIGRCEAILSLSGSPSHFISETDPFYDGALVPEAQPLAEAGPSGLDRGNARRTAKALNDYLLWAHRRLAAHPMNEARQGRGRPPIKFLLTKWAAVRPRVPAFFDQTGLKGASVESYPLYVGIARVLGLTSVAPPPNPDVTADLAAKLRLADDLFGQGHDFVHVHTKAPDVAAHRKDPAAKQRALEAIDAALAPLLDWARPDGDRVIVVTGDHATPSSGPLIHSGEAVPLLIVGGPNVLADGVDAFDERSAARGGLGHIFGRDLLPILLNLTDRVRLHGVRHQSEDRPYWARNPVALRVEPGHAPAERRFGADGAGPEPSGRG